MKKREVVITGIGLVTPSGLGWASYWDDVLHARSRISPIPYLAESGFRPFIAGQVVNFNIRDYIENRKQLKVMSREIQFAIAASHLALRDGGLERRAVDPFRAGISLGAGVLNVDLEEVGAGIQAGIDADGHFQMRKFGQDGLRALFPLWFLKYLPNMPACHISIMHKFQGPCNTITTSAAAGAQAIGEALHVIQRGDADVMLAGAADSKVNPMGLSRFHLLGLLSRKNGTIEAKDVYCPFDVSSDGMILGEGAGILLLEEREFAEKRGAHIYGEIVGYGSSSDFNCDPSCGEDYNGKCRSIERALEQAGVHPKDVDFILANGSGIRQEDAQESQEIRKIFDKYFDRIKITAVKPITGHMVYASAGVEIAAGIVALNEGTIPPVTNLKKASAIGDLPYVIDKPFKKHSRFFLMNSFGFGGQNASLVVKK
ncbi:MAG: beta-ketoacyl-[acyl-carrier-protein] synthase family protein [Candidatus Omnitrophota bacterium]